MPDPTNKNTYNFAGFKKFFTQTDSAWSGNSWQCQSGLSEGKIGGRGSFITTLTMMLDSFGYSLSSPLSPGSVASLISNQLVDNYCNFVYDFDANAITAPFSFDKTIQLLDGTLYQIREFSISDIIHFYDPNQVVKAIRTITGKDNYVIIAVWSKTIMSGMIPLDHFEFAHNTMLLSWTYDEKQSFSSQYANIQFEIADPLKTEKETLSFCNDETVDDGIVVRKCIKELRLYKY